MELFTDHVFLARLQFAVTTMLHIIWPLVTIGLSLFLVLLESLWIKTGDADYYRLARFWGKLFILNFGVGVVTGVPLEFEFGTNWAPFSTAVGDFFGNILGFEGAMAFMLEAGFVGIMAFGWDRTPRLMHLLATIMVAFGASLSAFWIMTANGWMQSPSGGILEHGVFVLQSYRDAIFNPNMPWAVSHRVACLETTLFLIGGISAWYMLHGRETAFILKNFKLVLVAVVVVAPLQIYLGDGSGRFIFEYQPAKGAAIEGHWETNPPGRGAAWALLAWPDKAAQQNLWSVNIPDLLSILTTGTLDGRVTGLKAFSPADQPPALPLLFYAFRVMVGIGFFFLGLMLWTGWIGLRGRLTPARIGAERALLRAWVFAIPLGYLAAECGWVVREVGRQPWIVYGLIRTSEGASALPPATVGGSLTAYFLIDVGLAFLFIIFARRHLKQGPDMHAPLPLYGVTGH